MTMTMYQHRTQFLSTPSARRATVHTQQPLWEREISIHALREEGDWMAVPRFAALFRFLSTPSARRATWPDDAVNYCTEFLSTPSARRATRFATEVSE